MRFAELRGQENVRNLLTEQAVSGLVNHAYIFCGQDGIGKFSVAEGFARMIMCEAPGRDGSACGRCKSCLMHDSRSNPDIKIYDIPQVKYVIEFITLL